MSKRLKIVFTLSVLLNVVFLGLIAGHSYKDNMLKLHFKDVDVADETHSVMKNAFDQKRQEIRHAVKAIQEKRQNLEKIISATEFDEQAYQEAIDDWLVFSKALTAGKQDFFMDILVQLPASERQKLAPKFASILMGHNKHKKGKRWKASGVVQESSKTSSR